MAFFATFLGTQTACGQEAEGHPEMDSTCQPEAAFNFIRPHLKIASLLASAASGVTSDSCGFNRKSISQRVLDISGSTPKFWEDLKTRNLGNGISDKLAPSIPKTPMLRWSPLNIFRSLIHTGPLKEAQVVS